MCIAVLVIFLFKFFSKYPFSQADEKLSSRKFDSPESVEMLGKSYGIKVM